MYIVSIFLFILTGLAVIQMILIIFLLSKNRKGSGEDVTRYLIEYKERLEKNEINIRDEFSRNRVELSNSLTPVETKLASQITNFTGIVDQKMGNIQQFFDRGMKSNREELNNSITAFEKKVSANLSNFFETLNNGLTSLQDRLSNTTKESRNELAASLKSFEEKSSARIQDLTEKTIQGLDKNRAIVDNKLAEIQKNNDEKLERMRETVEEKLQKTLESRIGESFKQVSENLERVQKGLGEMQNLATDVGGLKNVLSNIRSRGSFGEFQLENIIEEMLEINQYEKQCLLTPGNKVDFAINIPSKEDEGGFILLPIDAKFPTADYDRLTDAYHNGNKEEIDRSRKALAARIEDEAKSIRDKYIVSPKTTDFAIMFLPFESLYAEVLQIPGLLQKIQSYKITIAGPTTIFAFLTSLQMGFKTLNVNKRTGEISKLLSEVKQEFGKFENAFKTAKQKIDSASQYLEDEIGKRTRKMARTLKTVDTLPANKTENLLDVSLDDDYEDNGS